MLQPAQRLRFVIECHVQRGDGERCVWHVGLAVQTDGTEPDAERLRLSLLAGVDRRQRQPRQDFLQELVELVATHVALEFQPLDARRRESTAPRPGFELAQRFAAVDDLFIEKRERGTRTDPREIGEVLVRVIDG